MNKWLVRLIGLGLAMAVMVSVVGTVAAQGPGDRWPGLRDRGLRLWDNVAQALADASGLTWQDVWAELRAGKTLSEVLTEKGLDPATITAQAKAELEAEIAQAALEGRITQYQAELLTARLDDALARALSLTAPIAPRLRERVQLRLDSTLIGVLAEMAGQDPADVLANALTPPTLAEIATDLGLDPEAIVTETAARVTEQINQMVAQGDLSEAAAAQVLEGLQERLTERMNSPIGYWLGQLGPFGPGEGWFGGQGPMRQGGGWFGGQGPMRQGPMMPGGPSM